MSEKLALLGGEPVRTRPFPPRPPYGIAERNAANNVLGYGDLSGFLADSTEAFLGGPAVRALEAAFCETFGVKHAVSMNSATSCLFGAAKAVTSPRDEVIVTPWSMAASSTCVLEAGATPVFADIEPVTYGLDPLSVRDVVTPRTKAIVTVDLFGCPSRSLGYIKTRYPHIKIIEDAAQAIGARRDDRWAGTIGDVGVFSLNRHKTIHCGEGGVAVTDDDEIADFLRCYRNHGEVRPFRRRGYWGGNYRMGEVEAALARVQLERLEELTMPRIYHAERLTAALGELDGIHPPVVPKGLQHVYYLYAVRIEEKLSGMMHIALRAEGIPCDRYVSPLYRLPVLRGHGRRDDSRDWTGWYSNVERAYREVVVLPHVHAGMKDEDVDDVIAAFRKVSEHRDEL